jgi:hypothetical protein
MSYMPSGRKPASTESETNGGEAELRSDYLQYIADMLLELKSMADKEGCTTLAGLLALSYAEAQLKARRG